MHYLKLELIVTTKTILCFPKRGYNYRVLFFNKGMINQLRTLFRQLYCINDTIFDCISMYINDNIVDYRTNRYPTV